MIRVVSLGSRISSELDSRISYAPVMMSSSPSPVNRLNTMTPAFFSVPCPVVFSMTFGTQTRLPSASAASASSNTSTSLRIGIYRHTSVASSYASISMILRQITWDASATVSSSSALRSARTAFLISFFVSMCSLSFLHSALLLYNQIDRARNMTAFYSGTSRPVRPLHLSAHRKNRIIHGSLCHYAVLWY